ncbi:MAG: hypothetical protein GF317_00820 [Candidatus Lokiarchaeota archaeon]|nr:hypothetical protein [Candidatus Lokiarchaeota archaeon]MBD3198503.1 hypothetical protein [Candidatus Lokiarchaeota archaeon]
MVVPKISEVLEEKGQISDELDYALMKYLLENRGTGYTPCQPQLVRLEDGSEVIKVNIDNTFVSKDNNTLMGLGIVGKMFIDSKTLNVVYATPKDELEANIEKLKNSGITPQPRPKGKY